MVEGPPIDYPETIRRIRSRLGVTQTGLAEILGVSFATVNRWENRQSKPSPSLWRQIQQLQREWHQRDQSATDLPESDEEPLLDFTSSPKIVEAIAEGERLSFGHLANSAFATEISAIDPLPHQRIAVYERMLPQAPLRFLLADDAGAGKTIMAGLYIREMLNRRLLRRVLIVPPAGLIGNWRRELLTLFDLRFEIVSGVDVQESNPFVGKASDQLIVSIDTLAGPRVFECLRSADAIPYDLIVFDEAHKLSASRGADLRVHKTDRYRVAEALAGASDEPGRWRLGWSARHILLLTATPHMGKDYPYFALWRLLEPRSLSTPEAFQDLPHESRRSHFIRRTKEEMVYLNGKPIYPKRVSDTLGYSLTQGETSEQGLYEETTEYLRLVYNRAKLLNREAARLAMGVFQRRLASSTFALLRSFERRIQKLDDLMMQIEDGRLTAEQLEALQRSISEADDLLETTTGDEETPIEGKEESEAREERLLQGVVATSLAELQAERERVRELWDLARRVYELGHESKFDRFCEVLTDPRYRDEKLIIFTEYRDTLDFLVKRLGGMGYAHEIGQIHGGMSFSERDREADRFRRKAEEGGSRVLVCTDAAGEGINLQVCWIMINYDLPWNPARLEQRMGRIHRYGQHHDPVLILNLLAPSTREGKVLEVLLEKLERIRKELNSDKVFDCIGRVFQNVSIKRYMEIALTEGTDAVAEKLSRYLTATKLREIELEDGAIYGSGGEVAFELPRIRDSVEREVYARLLPGYVRHYLETAAPLIDLKLLGNSSELFRFVPARSGALDPLAPALESYPQELRERLSVIRRIDSGDAIWVRPGEPLFEGLRAAVSGRLSTAALKGAVFVDPTSREPYLFHLARIQMVRGSDPTAEKPGLATPLSYRLVGVKQTHNGELSPCPVESLLLLKGGSGLPESAQVLAAHGAEARQRARTYLRDVVGRSMVERAKADLAASLPEREAAILRGFDYEEAELARMRALHAERARKGSAKAVEALDQIKMRQRDLAARRSEASAAVRREPNLITLGELTFIAHAIVAPSMNPVDVEAQRVASETTAMDFARAFEEAQGATVIDVHTPELALAANLQASPGFDLLSRRPGEPDRAIEVKGRAESGEVEVLSNEWARACILRERYWLYVVYDCATPIPRLHRVQDPFGRLLTKAKGSVLISAGEIVRVSEAS